MSKRKTQKRKARITELRVDFGKDATIAGITPPGDGPLQFVGVDGKPIVPKLIEVGMAYERPEKGPKVINRVQANPVNIQREPTTALMRFGTLLAIDTGTRVIDGVSVSVTAWIALLGLRWISPIQWHASVADQDALEFHDAIVPPELFGWHQIATLVATQSLRGPIGLIVDSELGRLSEINQRKQPLFKDVYLPEGVELIFATSDAGTSEFVGNKALQHCDSVAKRLLKRIEQEPALRSWQDTAAPNQWVSRQRVWSKDNRDG